MTTTATRQMTRTRARVWPTFVHNKWMSEWIIKVIEVIIGHVMYADNIDTTTITKIWWKKSEREMAERVFRWDNTKFSNILNAIVNKIAIDEEHRSKMIPIQIDLT